MYILHYTIYIIRTNKERFNCIIIWIRATLEKSENQPTHYICAYVSYIHDLFEKQIRILHKMYVQLIRIC